jgi:hypothetical protein
MFLRTSGDNLTGFDVLDVVCPRRPCTFILYRQHMAIDMHGLSNNRRETLSRQLSVNTVVTTLLGLKCTYRKRC